MAWRIYLLRPVYLTSMVWKLENRFFQAFLIFNPPPTVDVKNIIRTFTLIPFLTKRVCGKVSLIENIMAVLFIDVHNGDISHIVEIIVYIVFVCYLHVKLEHLLYVKIHWTNKIVSTKLQFVITTLVLNFGYKLTQIHT